MSWILIANQFPYELQTDSIIFTGVLRVLAILIIIIMLGFRLLHLLASGFFTGNQYKKIDGLLYVKHPGEDWILLSEHERDQKKLRENK